MGVGLRMLGLVETEARALCSEFLIILLCNNCIVSAMKNCGTLGKVSSMS